MTINPRDTLPLQELMEECSGSDRVLFLVLLIRAVFYI